MKCKSIVLLILFQLLLLACSKNENFNDSNIMQNEEIIECVNQINNTIEETFLEAKSINDIVPYIEEIRSIEGVESAQIDGSALCIQLNNGRKIFWLITPEEKDTREFITLKSKIEKKSEMNSKAESNKKLCIINQQSNDLSRESFKEIYNNFADNTEKLDFINVNRINAGGFTPQFIRNELTKYDYIFMVTHGAYFSKTNKHWILTGLEFPINTFNVDTFNKMNPDKLMVGFIKENRKGTLFTFEKSVPYIAVSEDFFKEEISTNFQENSIMFCTACYSLANNNNISKILQDKGLGCYLGYTCWNSVGKSAGPTFFSYMFDFKRNVSEAYNLLSEDLKTESYTTEDGKHITSRLKYYPENCNISIYDEFTPTKGEAIDLGLSVKWSSCNLGSTEPQELGNIYTNDNQFVVDIYKNSPELFVMKNNSIISADICLSKYDYANNLYGGKWRMPNYKEMKELKDKCTWQVEILNGVPGIKIIGPNQNSIFLPGKTDVIGSEEWGIYSFSGCYMTGTYDVNIDSSSFVSLFFNGVTGPYSYHESIFGGINDVYIRPVCD